jgi:hypothetical protein
MKWYNVLYMLWALNVFQLLNRVSHAKYVLSMQKLWKWYVYHMTTSIVRGSTYKYVYVTLGLAIGMLRIICIRDSICFDNLNCIREVQVCLCYLMVWVPVLRITFNRDRYVLLISIVQGIRYKYVYTTLWHEYWYVIITSTEWGFIYGYAIMMR